MTVGSLKCCLLIVFRRMRKLQRKQRSFAGSGARHEAPKPTGHAHNIVRLCLPMLKLSRHFPGESCRIPDGEVSLVLSQSV